MNKLFLKLIAMGAKPEDVDSIIARYKKTGVLSVK